MKRWDDYSYDDQMQLIADALGVRHWSSSDNTTEDVLDLLDKLRERGLQNEYIRHLSNICFGGAWHLTYTQVFNLIMATPDQCYHAAALALGAIKDP